MRGYAYRRTMKAKKDRKLRKILSNCRYTPHAGSVEYGWVDGVWQPVREYIQYPKIRICKSILSDSLTAKTDAPRPFPTATVTGNVWSTGGSFIREEDYYGLLFKSSSKACNL